MIADKAADFYAVFVGVDTIAIFKYVCAVNAGKCFFFTLAERLQNAFAVDKIAKRNIGAGKNEAGDKRADVGFFAAVGL